MKFLIQKIDKKIVHDFSFVLLQAIDFRNWFNSLDKIKVKYFNTISEQEKFDFEPIHHEFTPVGSVEFVSAYLQQFYGLTPKPLNVPEELFPYACRHIFNGTEAFFPHCGKSFIKSNDKIKGTCGIFNSKEPITLFAGNYQFSEVIGIDSEWRAFVYQNKLVGLENYCGEFTMFPDVYMIKRMIAAYKSAPISYTLDVGINNEGATFVIEIHPMVSVGLYGFADHAILPNMFYKAFKELIKNK